MNTRMRNGSINRNSFMEFHFFLSANSFICILPSQAQTFHNQNFTQQFIWSVALFIVKLAFCLHYTSAYALLSIFLLLSCYFSMILTICNFIYPYFTCIFVSFY